MPTKPLRKAQTTRTRNPLNDRLPTPRGQYACDHQDKRPCFRVVIEVEDKDFHSPDEGGAVMLAMRQSRLLECTATVYDPNGNVVCQFGKREYDWRPLQHRFTAYNEHAAMNNEESIARRTKSQPKKPLKKPLKRK